jgi:hypothetical protein
MRATAIRFDSGLLLSLCVLGGELPFWDSFMGTGKPVASAPFAIAGLASVNGPRRVFAKTPLDVLSQLY